MTFLSMIIMIMFIPIIMLMISIMVNNKKCISNSGKSPFECGFDIKNMSREPFSIRFFVISILFLVFDVEVSVLLPIGLLHSNNETFMIGPLIFLLIISVGLLYEWKNDVLEWS